MFHRITYEDWTTVVPIIGFVLTFGVFAIVVVRAILMKKKKRDHMANLPLDNETSSPEHGSKET